MTMHAASHQGWQYPWAQQRGEERQKADTNLLVKNQQEWQQNVFWQVPTNPIQAPAAAYFQPYPSQYPEYCQQMHYPQIPQYMQMPRHQPQYYPLYNQLFVQQHRSTQTLAFIEKLEKMAEKLTLAIEVDKTISPEIYAQDPIIRHFLDFFNVVKATNAGELQQSVFVHGEAILQKIREIFGDRLRPVTAEQKTRQIFYSHREFFHPKKKKREKD